ncbi:hypothetical protein PHMEG_00033430, partial [Phytophthora megakarya]
MRVALEVCGEFLSRIGALEGANAIAEILRKTGMELPDTSPFRWRALLAAIRQELDAEPMDVVFLFERLLQLDATMPSGPSHKLFDSPLFFHLLVERFAVVFEGLDAELFKLESDELCHIDGIYETCLLIRDKIQETEPNDLRKFLETFEKIFEQDEPKDCWDAFYELYQLSDAPFRRDMKRALCMIEAVTLGPTKLELAFPSETAPSPKKVIPRALLEKRFGGTRREWGDLSQINSISRVGIDHPTDNMHEQQDNQERETHEPDTTGNIAVEASRLPAESLENQDVNGQSTESKQQKQKKWQHQNNQLRRDHLVPLKLQEQIANKVAVGFLVRGYLVKVAPPPLLKKVEKVFAVADAKEYSGQRRKKQLSSRVIGSLSRILTCGCSPS